MAFDHLTQTMDVWVDGKIEKRPIDYVRADAPFGQRHHPQLAEDERLVWLIANDVPMIVKGIR